jgi:hypothetical protein
MRDGYHAMAEALSNRALNRATLSRQLLLERARISTLEAIEHLVGLQAQSPFSPYYGLWSRLRDFRASHLVDLLKERDVVRVVLMRGTVHMVTARDCRSLRRLVQSVMERDLRVNTEHGKALEGLDHKAFVQIAKQVLSGPPLGVKELGVRLQEQWPTRSPASLAYAARDLLCLVQTPPRAVWGRSGTPRLTTADAWLGPEATACAMTLSTLVLRYLSAFGPASVRDVQTWCGLTHLSEVVNRLGGQLRKFQSEDGAELYDTDDAPRPAADSPAPVRLVAPFDNLLLSHLDRARVMSKRVRTLLFSQKNGSIPGAVLVDGFVSGSWSLVEKRRKTVLTIKAFTRFSRSAQAELEHEVKRLLEQTAAPGATTDYQLVNGG